MTPRRWGFETSLTKRRGFVPAAFAFSLAAVAVAACAGHVPAVVTIGGRGGDAQLFSAEAYAADVRFLSGDALEGRGTGQPGIDKAAEYIADAFARFGVEPAGDDGTYFQEFPVKLSRRIGRGTRLKYGTHDGPARRRAKLRRDFAPLPFSSSGSFHGEVVFAGYGIVSDEHAYNDYDGLDVAGKVLLILRRAPRFDDFGIEYAAFRTKAARARAREAAAILIVNPTFDEAGDSLYEFEGREPNTGIRGSGYRIPMVHIRRGLAERLLAAGGLPDLATIEARIDETGKPRSAPLDGVTVKGRVNIEPVERPARNIVGMIPGRGPQAEQIIVLGAHYDHLGVRDKGTDDFDPEEDIFNGADDNASGTAMVLSLARAFTEGPAPERSLLVMLFTGEERGLLGSNYFVKHPTIDLDRVIAMINFDMVGRLRDDRLHVAGMRTGGFEELVEQTAKAYGLEIKDGGGGRGPSDHTSFYNHDIPVMFMHTGLHKQYHQPQDDADLINAEGAVRIARFTADLIDDLDARPLPPQFVKDNRPMRLAFRDRGGDEDDDAATRAADRRGDRARDEAAAEAEPDRRGRGATVADNGASRAALDNAYELLTAYADWVMRRESIAGAPVRAGVDHRETWVEIHVEGANDEALECVRKDRSDLIRRLRAIDDHWTFQFTEINSASADEWTVRFRMMRSESTEPSRTARAPDQPSEASGAARSETSAKVKPDKKKDPHADLPDDVTATPMPPVRLGIMPTYGEPEGEGYEISGVVEGGPAARAGMKDDDRILKIGDAEVRDIYSYMDALRRYKPGDAIKVTVLRGGKRMVLTIEAAKQKSAEAS